jgi:DNA repair protein RadC
MIQLRFNFESTEAPECSLADARAPVPSQEHRYGSVKRVFLVYEATLQDRPRITSTDEAKRLFKSYWKQNPANDQEQFVIACLDTKHRVQCIVKVTVGTLDASLVHPREVFKPAIIEGSSAVLLSHNHPSGNTEPSREDIQVTERLTEAGKLIGISVLDHIIHGDGTGEVRSLREF